VAKPKSLQGKSITDILKNQVGRLYDKRDQLRGLGNCEFSVQRTDVSKVVSSLSFKQQLHKARENSRSLSRGMDR